MKHRIADVNAFFAEDKNGRITIIDRGDISNAGMGDSSKSINRHRRSHMEWPAEKMWRHLMQAVRDSGSVEIPVGAEESFTITTETKPHELIELAGRLYAESTQEEIKEDDARSYCASVLKRILEHACDRDEKFFSEAVSWIASRPNGWEPENKTSSKMFESCIDSEISAIGKMAEEDHPEAFFASMKGIKRAGSIAADYERTRKALVAEHSGIMDKSSYRDRRRTSLYAEALEHFLTRNWERLKSEASMSEILPSLKSKLMAERKAFTNPESIMSMPDSALAELLETISESGYERYGLISNPLLTLEIYRRGMDTRYGMAAEELVKTLSEMHKQFSTWPEIYSEQVDRIARDIASGAKDTTMEGVFMLLDTYCSRRAGNISTLEEAYKRYVKPNMGLLSGVSSLSGKSTEYREAIMWLKARVGSSPESERYWTENDAERVFVDERDQKTVRSGTLDSIYLKVLMVVNTFSREGDFMGEGLLREIYSDAFRALVSANKAERKNFIRMVSYALRSNKTLKTTMEPVDERLRMFLEELSASRLKDSTIQAILEKPEYSNESWRIREALTSRAILLMSYVDVAALLEKSGGVRSIIRQTLLRMELE
jgi:hypothetical protein